MTGTPDQPTTDQTDAAVLAWLNRTEQLVTVLTAVDRRVTFQLGPDDDVIYIQAHVDEDGSWWVEAVSNNYLPEHTQLSVDAEITLIELGWSPPTPEMPNFYRFYDGPVDHSRIAADVILAFVGAYDAAPDSEICVEPASLLKASSSPADDHADRRLAGDGIADRAQLAIWVDSSGIAAVARAGDGEVEWVVSGRVDDTLGPVIGDCTHRASRVDEATGATYIDQALLWEHLGASSQQPSFLTDSTLLCAVELERSDIEMATLITHFGNADEQIIISAAPHRWQIRASGGTVYEQVYERMVSTSHEVPIDGAWIWLLAQTFALRPELRTSARTHPNAVVRAMAGWD